MAKGTSSTRTVRTATRTAPAAPAATPAIASIYTRDKFNSDVAAWAASKGITGVDIDPAKIQRAAGLENPQQKYRIRPIGSSQGELPEEVELYAVDEADAINQAARTQNLSAHRYRFNVELVG